MGINKNIFENAKILIVDDVPENLQVLGNALMSKGAEIIVATDAYTALNNLRTVGIDIALVDVSMPGMDGFELCQKIKADSNLKETPVIFITARTDIEDIQKGFEVGAVDYILKPFNQIEVLSRVKSHLELYFSKKELEEHLLRKDKFISLIAHDIKSPLSGIKSLLKIAVEDYDNLEKGELKEILESLYESIETQFDFILDLLNWGRLQLDKLEPNPDLFDIEQLIDNCKSILQVNASNKNINIKVVNNTEDSRVEADPGFVENAIQNLLSNAIKFSHENSNITITISKDSDDIQIAITDQGVGMSDEDQTKLFRNDVLHTSEGTSGEKGTGLGLLLVKDFIEKTGGSISFESEEGKGSTFYLSLPSASNKELKTA